MKMWSEVILQGGDINKSTFSWHAIFISPQETQIHLELFYHFVDGKYWYEMRW